MQIIFWMELRDSGFFKERLGTTELENCGTSEQQAALQPEATKKIWFQLQQNFSS